MYSWQSISSGPIERRDLLWKREFFELALNRWATANSHTVEPRVMVLFHMNLTGIRTNLSHVHHFAHAYLRGEVGQNHLLSLALRTWRDGDDCNRGLWHANELIKAAENLYRPPKSGEDDEESRAARASEGFIEAPHVPFCIYLASLTLWAAGMVVQNPSVDEAKSHLESGVRILGHLKVRIAQVLRRILRRLIKAIDQTPA
jgi:hypothetical protein